MSFKKSIPKTNRNFEKNPNKYRTNIQQKSQIVAIKIPRTNNYLSSRFSTELIYRLMIFYNQYNDIQYSKIHHRYLHHNAQRRNIWYGTAIEREDVLQYRRNVFDAFVWNTSIEWLLHSFRFKWPEAVLMPVTIHFLTVHIRRMIFNAVRWLWIFYEMRMLPERRPCGSIWI